MSEPTPILTDASHIRERIREKAIQTAYAVFPLEAQGRKLEIEDVHVRNERYSPVREARALMTDGTLSEAMRGTLVLRDKDGTVLDRAKNFTIAHLPYFTDRHTVIANGNEYQIANQLRRKPGVYTARADNGELRAIFNLGRGKNFDLGFEPNKGTFHLAYGTSNIPLYPVLRALGVSHQTIADQWGKGVADANHTAHGHQTEKAVASLYAKVEHPVVMNPNLPHAEKVTALQRKYDQSTLDPRVTEATLGVAWDKVTPQALIGAAKKVLAVHNDKAQVDDTDSLTFKTFHSIDDFIAERMRLTARAWVPAAKRALNGKTNIREALRPAPFSDGLRKWVTTSSLSAVPTGINPLEMLDHAVKVTSLGEGGIPSDRAIPLDARMIHNTHIGALDPIRTPESNHSGVDIRATLAAHRDKEGNLYTVVKNVKTGKEEFLRSGELRKHVLAFPGEDLRGHVDAFVGGKVERVPGDKVTHQLLHTAHTYSPATTLIPMIHSIQGNRAIMGSKMGTQALPLLEREAPYVQVRSHLPGGESFETVYGHMFVPRATVSGTVKKIEDGWIYIKPDKEHEKKSEVRREDDDVDADGVKVAAEDDGLVKVPYQTLFPFPSKTYLHHELSVKPGDKVQEGQRLGESNYTRKGTLALGKNLLVAYMPYYGLNSNDAVVISEGCAKKLTSEHMYREVYALNPQIELSREKHRMYFGNKYTREQYGVLDETGVVKKGSRVHPKDLLVAGLTKTQVLGTDALLGRISKSLAKPYQEVTLSWTHGTPGEVVDVVRTATQIAILVRTHEQMQVGDKLCYDEQTEVLTDHGWKHFDLLDPLTDRVASLEGGALRYVEPEAYHRYARGGRMYAVSSQQLDLFVTDHHGMYVQRRGETEFALRPAEDIAGQRVRYKKDADWQGETPDHVVFPSLTVAAGQGGRGSRVLTPLRMRTDAYAMLLGAYLSEGNLVDQPESGSYGIDITQIKEPNRARLLTELRRLGLKFNEHGRGTKVRLYSKQILEHFRQFGHSHEKFIPPYVFDWDRNTLRILFDWLVWGDGSVANGRPVSYTTTSPRLADDVQRLCLHVGFAGNVKRKKHHPRQTIKGEEYDCRPCFDVRIVTTKLHPQVNHGHATSQKAQREGFVPDYESPVFCVTVPSGVIYVRRNGKGVWSGNSGRYGNKGVVAKILPDHEMVQDSKGRPIDLLLTSAGVVSRINPAQVIETAVGKVVEKTGKPIVFDNNARVNAVEWAKGLLREHGVSDKEHVYDPLQKRRIEGPDGKGVLVGRQFIYKLFKSTDTNFAAHGVGPYDLNQQPLKTGGDDSAKGLGKMEFDALIAHNARNFLREAATVKGQKNDEFWKALQLGMPLPAPKSPFAFQKFVGMLEGAGLRVDKRGSKMKLLPMTDRDVLARSRGPIENSKTLIAKNLKPETGGLFDPRLTGGPQGTLYAHIDLHEPIPSPVFQEPVRRLLGLTGKEFDRKLAEHGGQWFHAELKAMDVGAKMRALQGQLAKAKGAELNDVVKQIKYLKALQAEKMAPHEAYMISKVPVIPPVFRPIVTQPGDSSQVSIGDANKLYGHLMDSNDTLKATALESDRGKHRQQVFNAVAALYGTEDVANDELRGQSVKGFLSNIAGVGTPKGGFFQRKLMRRTQDVSGRGTAVPDANLGMDHVGMPEPMLWGMYDKMIVARLVRQGYPALEARERVTKRDHVAREAMLAETRERPVLINRAPTLHRWSIVAAYPVPVQGKTIRVNPFIEKGMNLDYDGDTLQVHAPITHDAIEDARKMTLSQMLLADQTHSRLMAFPQHEAIIGFTHASKAVASGAKPREFASADEAVKAWRRGEIKLNDPVTLKGTKTASEQDPDTNLTRLLSWLESQPDG